MKTRTILVAGSYAQCALAVLAVGAAAIAAVVAASCMADAVVAAISSEREE